MLARSDEPPYDMKGSVMADVIVEAGRNDLALREVVQMPANNLSVVFSKVG